MAQGAESRNAADGGGGLRYSYRTTSGSRAILKGEYYVLGLVSTLGAMVLISAGSLITCISAWN